jgi:simple sugar transport system permease protein
MAASGALAGLIAANFVLGGDHYFQNGMGKGVGFVGIAVALLGRNHPAGVVVAALFFGTLEQGAFEVSSLIPKEVVEIIEAVVILAVVATSAEVRRLGRKERS